MSPPLTSAHSEAIVGGTEPVEPGVASIGSLRRPEVVEPTCRGVPSRGIRRGDLRQPAIDRRAEETRPQIGVPDPRRLLLQVRRCLARDIRGAGVTGGHEYVVNV